MGRLAAIVVALAVAACYQPAPATGVPCAANGECPGPQLCDHGQTPPVCVSMLPAIDAPRLPDARVDAPPDVARVPDAPPDAPPPPTASLVQQITSQALSGATLSATLPSLPASGHLLVMVGDIPQANIVTVTGGGVTTWVKATGAFQNCNSEVWFGVTDGSSATVTIGDPANTTEMWMDVSEWSGLITTTPLDSAIAASGTTSPASPGALVTAHAKDLLILVVTDSSPNTFGVPGPGTWTALTPIDVGGCVQDAWYETVAAAGSYTPSATETSHDWDASVAAFRIAP